jgi:hypothetical protein
MTPTYTPKYIEEMDLAIRLCEDRNGEGSWSTPNRKRACYLVRAQKIIAARKPAWRRMTLWQKIVAFFTPQRTPLRSSQIFLG